MTERMGTVFAVFNLHVNDAGEKAKRIFIANFGQDMWDEVMQPLEDAGIMSIFDQEPTPFLSFYITTVLLLVNGDVTVKENNMLITTDATDSKGFPVRIDISTGRMDGKVIFSVYEPDGHPHGGKLLADFLLTEEDARALKEKL